MKMFEVDVFQEGYTTSRLTARNIKKRLMEQRVMEGPVTSNCDRHSAFRSKDHCSSER